MVTLLVPLLASFPSHLMPMSQPASTFFQHIHDFHAEIRRKISSSNGNYKLSANACRRAVNFDVVDFVIACIRPERFPKKSLKKLHARAMGPYQIIRQLGSNAYVLDLP